MERHPDGRYRIDFQPSGGSPEVLARAKKYRVAAILYNQHFQRLMTEGADGILALHERPDSAQPMVVHRIAPPEQIRREFDSASNKPDFTDQERIIQQRLGESKTRREIADELHISQSSLTRRIHQLLRKADGWHRQQLGFPAFGPPNWLATFERWQPSDNWTCPHCGSIFAMKYFQLSQRGQDHIICSVCGQILRAWNESADYQATLIERRDPPADH